MKKNTFNVWCLAMVMMSMTVSSSMAKSHLVSGKRVEALNTSAWEKSMWISVKNAPVVTGEVRDGSRAADGANWFMTSVENRQKVVKATWMTASLGVSELFVNGKRIGEEVLRPGFTHREKTKRSFTYDVTDVFLKKAGQRNVLSAQVTPGWWADKIVTPWGTNGMIGHKCAFRGVLVIEYADGSKQTYGTNLQDWKAGIAGPVTHAGIYDGEAYDARIAQGFSTPEAFSTPEENTEFRGDILPSCGAEVYAREDLALTPVQAYIWKEVSGARDGEFGKVVIDRTFKPGQEITLHAGETLVVDFGQNCAAVPSFVFKAAAGTRLSCLPGELLNDGNGARSRGMDGPEGTVHRENLRAHDNCFRLDYTFAGNGQYETYQPRATFFGYRYVSISATATVCIKSLRSVPVTSIHKNLEIGTISTGHELVNRLISNTLWGLRSNYLSVPTDCPQRNERLGWTADTQVFTETGTFFADTKNFFHKWMRDMSDSQDALGGYPGVAPVAQYGGECMRLGWTDAGIIVPWTIWKQFADTEIINQSWESMKRFIDRVNATCYRHQDLVSQNGNYQWADWLSYEPLESCGGSAFDSHGPLPEAVEYWNYLSACYWQMDAEMMRDMAKATGRDYKTYEEMAIRAKTYTQEHFLNADGTFKTQILNTMQTPALFALKNHLVDGQAKQQMVARLRQNFKDHDGCLQTGFLGTSIIMGTLTDNGMADIAYDLLFQRKNPSWLYSIDNGATTMWERWNSYMKDKGMGPRGMNSFNHYAYGAVCEWIWETVAGIAADPTQPGFKHIIMRPVPDKRLGHLDAQYQSAAGLIKSHWHYDKDGQWNWQFTIPKGASATVYLPGETMPKEYKSGTYKIKKVQE